MTECITKAIEFSRIDRRQVTADFLGGRLTSDAGILLLREVDREIGLLDAINEAIPDPRDPAAITHDQRTMLAQRIFSIALGYEDLNDQQTMRTDAALQVAAGVDAEEDNPMEITRWLLQRRFAGLALVENGDVLDPDTFSGQHVVGGPGYGGDVFEGTGTAYIGFLTDQNNVGWFKINFVPQGDIVCSAGEYGSAGENLAVGGTEPTLILGDVNQDGAVNLLDVNPFVELLTNGQFQAEGDINQDGAVNLLDVDPFVDILTGQ